MSGVIRTTLCLLFADLFSGIGACLRRHAAEKCKAGEATSYRAQLERALEKNNVPLRPRGVEPLSVQLRRRVCPVPAINNDDIPKRWPRNIHQGRTEVVVEPQPAVPAAEVE